MNEQDYIWSILDDVFPSAEDTSVYKTDLKLELERLERGSIENALDASKGNRTKAADMLSIGRTCLIAKMKKYELV